MSTSTTQVKNIVLVHGAFADGSCWSKVIPPLLAKGFKVSVVQNPLSSLADDVTAVNRVLTEQEGPVLLVGHSWGGAVITEAGSDAKWSALCMSPPARRTAASPSAIGGRIIPLRRVRRRLNRTAKMATSR